MNNISKVITAVVTPLQDIENALQQLLARNVNDAKGITLDAFGKLVGERRADPDDEVYRRLVRARIAVNRSSGTITDMLKVAKLVLNEPLSHLLITNDGNAEQTLRVQDVALDATVIALLVKFVRDTEAGGVRTIVQYGVTPPSGWMKFDTVGKGFDVAPMVGSAV